MNSRLICAILISAPLSCVPIATLPAVPTPAELLPQPIPATGRLVQISQSLLSIGHLAPGDEATITILSADSPTAFVLDTSGNIIDGAQAVSALVFLAHAEDDYYLFLESRSLTSRFDLVSLTVQADQPVPEREPQVFVLDFNGADAVELSDGKVFSQLSPMDLTAFGATSEDKAFLAELEPVVRSLIRDRLNAIFGRYEMMVFVSGDEAGVSEFSTVYFTNSVGPPSNDLFDTTEAASENGAGESEEPSLILYGAAGMDLGNRHPNDDAVVFVGSFIGQPLLETSVNDLVNILAHSAAHEMGHLLGLQHVFRRGDIMWGRPNVAFSRDIDFGRAQVMLGDYLFEFLYQDPDRYLRRINGLSPLDACKAGGT